MWYVTVDEGRVPIAYDRSPPPAWQPWIQSVRVDQLQDYWQPQDYRRSERSLLELADNAYDWIHDLAGRLP